MISVSPAPSRGKAAKPPRQPRAAAAGARSRVHNPTGNASTAGQASDRRRWRELQAAGYEVVGRHERVKTCGTVPLLRSGRVALGIGESGGLQRCGYRRCGSRWCADCWSKVSASRAADVEAVLDWAAGEGYAVGLITLTAAHVHASTLEACGGDLVAALAATSTKELRESMASAWRRMHSGRRGQAIKAARQGYIRALELTVDDLRVSRVPSGVHVHWHVAVIADDPAAFEECAALMREGWIAACEREDLTAHEAGFDAQIVRDRGGVAGYLVKGEKQLGGVHLELTHSATKAAGSGRCSPEQVLRSVAECGDGDGGGLLRRRLTAQWMDVEEGTDRARWLTWSRGLRKRAGLGAELTEEQIVEQEHRPEGDRVAVVRDADLAHRGVTPESMQAAVRERPADERWRGLLVHLARHRVPFEVMDWDGWVALRDAERARMREASPPA